jgi:Lrp/AsnC family transcriptional regulator for asnA, asnC and gidA
VELGKKLNMSPSTAYIRVRRLKEAGYIKRTIVLIDYSKVGYRIKAFIFVKVDPKKFNDVVKLIEKIDKVLQIYDITGEPALLLYAITKDHEDLASLLDEIGKIDGVLSTNTMVVLRTLKEDYKVRIK